MIHQATRVSSMVLLMALPIAVSAQMYGASPFQNGASGTPQAGLQKFDPDTGAACFDEGMGTVCPEARQFSLPGFTITGVNSIKIDPTDGTDPAIPAIPGDPDDDRDFAYGIFKVSGVSGRVLGLVDLATGDVRQLGSLGDNFSSLAFDAEGNLYGVTGDGATVPESVYAIDKTNGARTLLGALGNGADGELIEFNPLDQKFYHWSGNGTVVFERFEIINGGTTIANVTPIPFTGTTGGESFGSAWDPCLDQFIVSNISSTFRRWTLTEAPLGATIDASFGVNPDDMRGLALIGPASCDLDVVATIDADVRVPAALDTVNVTGTARNAGPARSLGTVITFTLPPSLTYVAGAGDDAGCTESPVGTITCPVAGTTGPSILKNGTVSRTLVTTSDGGLGTIEVEITTTSDDIDVVNNTATFGLGLDIFEDGFETIAP
jgi:hypothetical protein